MKRFLILAACLALSTVQSFPQNTPEYRTNAELFEELLSRVSRTLFETLASDHPVAVNVHYPQYDWFVKHRVVEILQGAGYTVSAGSGNTEDLQIVDIGVESLVIEYGKQYGGTFFGTLMVERRAIAAFSIALMIDGTEEIYRSDLSVQEDIPVGQIDSVENPSLPFTMSTRPSGSLLDRVLGPVVIISVTAAIIYLFFSVRS